MGYASNDDGSIQIPDENELYPYYSVDQSIEKLLEVYADRIGVHLSIDSEFPDEQNNRNFNASNLTRLEYLNELSKTYAFIWYFDGNVLHIEHISSINTETIPLRNNNGNEILDILKELNIVQDKFKHFTSRKNRIISVTGPKKYIENLENAISSIEEGRKNSITILRGENLINDQLIRDTSSVDTSLPELSE